MLRLHESRKNESKTLPRWSLSLISREKLITCNFVKVGKQLSKVINC
ncbi:MAG: hypothetical protein ACTS4Z_00290 [Candidatus Hodgkinia cicadicola]